MHKCAVKSQLRVQKRVRRKLYAMMYNVCKFCVLGFDLCIIKYHVKCNDGRTAAWYTFDRHVDGFSEGAAFYASGNVASEALRHYCTDLWTEEYAAKAARTGEQRMKLFCLTSVHSFGFDLCNNRRGVVRPGRYASGARSDYIHACYACICTAHACNASSRPYHYSAVRVSSVRSIVDTNYGFTITRRRRRYRYICVL